MPSKPGVALVTVVLIAAFAAVLLLLRESGPSFEGKSARYWINYRYSGPNVQLQFQTVWKGMGSNAVPFLTAALAVRANASPNWYGGVLRSLPSPIRQVLPAPTAPPEIIRCRAASALGILGGASKPAVPALRRVTETDEDTLVRSTAAQALEAIATAQSPNNQTR